MTTETILFNYFKQESKLMLQDFLKEIIQKYKIKEPKREIKRFQLNKTDNHFYYVYKKHLWRVGFYNGINKISFGIIKANTFGE